MHHPHGKPAPFLADEPRSAPDVVHLLAVKWVSYPCNSITKGQALFNKFFLVSFNNTFQTTEQVKEVSPYGIAAAIAGAQLFAVFMFHIQYRRDHISPTLNALRWLSIKEHLQRTSQRCV
jgi:hypothetical protein